MKKYVLKKITNSVKSKINFSDELNPAQLEAVNHIDGPILVIAGAGSGKTRTLVYRVAKLVETGIEPKEILLLTFTKKASAEMLNRASQILDSRCQDVSGGTFHSFSAQILRKYGEILGYSKDFTILDRSDAEDLIGIIRKDMGLNKIDKRFPKKRTLADIFSKYNNTQKSIQQITENQYPQFIEYVKDFERIYQQYKIQKIKMSVMDYDDLLCEFRYLLQNYSDIQRKIESQYKYIMVDEYQDTNKIQADIIYELAKGHRNIFIVGDDAQSIYSFRGANYKNILEFPKIFTDTKIITLEENYRSYQPILNLTNALISRAREKFTKTLFTTKSGGEKPVYIETISENEQSRFICQKILELREEGIPLDNIAVLFRSSWHANDLEIELKTHNIPYIKQGGFKFIETAHIKDVLAYLKVIVNPKDGISWQRILLMISGIGIKAVDQILNYIWTQENNLTKLQELSPFKKKSYYQEISHLIKLIYFYHKNEKLSPSLLLDKILIFYRPLLKLNYDDFQKRELDLDSLQNIAERYSNLEDFLTEMSLEPPDATQDNSIVITEDNERLVISTIHSAKGMEWHTVFLISALDGFIPSFKSLGDLSEIEEERRLLYVALTRAKTNLFIIKPNLNSNKFKHFMGYPGMQFSKPSRFLLEGALLNNYSERWVLTKEESVSRENQIPKNSPKYIL